MPTILILGAASDMAIAIAKKFGSAGWEIQLAARHPDRCSDQAADLRIRYGVNCRVLAFDALDFNSHKAFFESINPKPDVVACVFGYLGDNEKGLADWEEAKRILDTNYTGAVSILNEVSVSFEKRNSGTIVGISSVAGERGRQSNFLYGSAKAGFTAYLSGLRNRLAHAQIHVMTVQPGFVYTRMTEGLPLPKMLTADPSEVGEAVFIGVKKKKNIIYVRWFWRWIMLIIKSIPEGIFKKLKL